MSDSVPTPVVDKFMSAVEFNRSNNSPYMAMQSIHTPSNDWTLDHVKHVTFKSLDQAHEFLNSYAAAVGFSLRKDRIFWTGQEGTGRKWVCSKEGKREEKYLVADGSKRRQRHVTRCECPAVFQVKLSRTDSLFYFVEFKNVHNHNLVDPTHSHFLRSHRKIDDASKHQIAELTAAGIKPSQVMDVLVSNRCGYRYVGFTRVDLYNHLYRSSETRKMDDDCDRALYYIQSLVNRDSGVFCRFNSDSDGRLKRLFYSDTNSRNDYRAFSDVVISDSTYKTNHFRLPLVLLLGVDNNYSTIVFAFALLSDEEGESYKWVYETFVACMEGKQPGVIVTDGDKAMRWGIREAMPLTHHRLCSWHLLRNATGVSRQPNFKHELGKLICKRFSKGDFEQLWTEFLEKYGLNKGDRRWVNDMESSKTLWAESYFDGVFLAGSRTTQRAEGANAALKKLVNPSLSLAQFIHQYVIFLDRSREECMEDDCINSQSMPAISPKQPYYSIREQVAKLYTLDIYNKVHTEMKKAEHFISDLRSLIVDHSELRYHVDKYDPCSPTQRRPEYVTYFRRDGDLKCTCGFMDFEGIPCRHIFSVIKALRIQNLPPTLLTKRWMRDARKMGTLSSSSAQSINGHARRMSIIRPLCDRLSYLSSRCDEHMEIAKKEVERLTQLLTGLQLQNPPNELNIVGLDEFVCLGEPIPKNPNIVRTKGAPRVRHATTRRTCSYCHEEGHTKPTCQVRQIMQHPV